jgi:hypothetical protein
MTTDHLRSPHSALTAADIDRLVRTAAYQRTIDGLNPSEFLRDSELSKPAAEPRRVGCGRDRARPTVTSVAYDPGYDDAVGS